MTELNLEGKATNQAIKLLHLTAKNLAKQAHGVVFDPQTDRVSTPSGVTRFVTPKKQKTFLVISMSWWFLNETMLSSAGRRAFLSSLEKWLPEALPKRYGDYQPPQYELVKTGMSHLERFVAKHLDNVMVWYPHRPVTHVHVGCPRDLGPGPNGFQTNLVNIEVESAALGQPGWAEQLRFFWREMTFLLQPIYGEVRSEGGYTWHGGSVYQAATALPNKYPFTTCSWFWRGIPLKLGHAVVLGEEYQRLWPTFLQRASVEKGYAFASTSDWLDETDLTKIVGPPPKEIALLPGPGMGPAQKYPRIWPFAPPFGATHDLPLAESRGEAFGAKSRLA